MATFEEIQKAKILGSYNLFTKSEESLGGEMVKGGLGSGRTPGTFRVGDKIKFHPHTSLKASKDGKGTGYAKHEGKITHAYPDGHFDVEDSKGFIARHHPEKNNFEKGESFTDFVGGETEKKYHKNFQKEDAKNPDEEDSNKVVKSEDNFEVEEVINLLNKSLFDELDIEKGGEGSRGGKVIGHTKSGKAIYDNVHNHENIKPAKGNIENGDHVVRHIKSIDRDHYGDQYNSMNVLSSHIKHDGQGGFHFNLGIKDSLTGDASNIKKVLDKKFPNHDSHVESADKGVVKVHLKKK